ncbi:MAG: hypothetical protein QG671_2969 [Actinomycetota bacterium]|nr:hypothetical protein [Actinomycetota bacterium]
MPHPATPPVPVLTVCSVDPVLRDSACTGLLLDLPGALAVRHDLQPLDDGASLLRRTVFDASGTLEHVETRLEHGCLSCALREDVLPTLLRLAQERPSALVLALPVTAEPLPVVKALTASTHTDPPWFALSQAQWQAEARTGLRVAAVVAALDGDALEEDLFGDDDVADRGMALSEFDDRGMGEALSRHLEYADAILVAGRATPRQRTILAHLALPELAAEVSPLHEADATRLLAMTRPLSDPRGDLLRTEPSGSADAYGVWSVDLCSDRPLHPDRLLERIEDLGCGRTRACGHFWVPTRPRNACAWDGAGGQLSIGTIGPWPPGRRPITRLVVTGTDGSEWSRTPQDLRSIFDTVLLDDAEMARGSRWWANRPDSLDPWLGDPHELTDCA